MRIKNNIFVMCLLCMHGMLAGQWNPDAGLAVPLSSNATVESSSRDSLSHLILDGNTNTAWESSFEFPFPYLKKPSLNILFESPDSLFCSSLPKDSTFMDSIYTATVQVDSFYVDTIVVDSVTMDTFMIDSTFMDTIVVDSIVMDTVQVDSVYYNDTTMMNDTVQVDSIVIDTFMIDSVFVDTIVVDSIFVDTVMVDSIYIDSIQIDSMFIDTISINTSNTDNNDYAVLTDGVVETGNIVMPVSNGWAWIGLEFLSPRPILGISAKMYSTADIAIYAYTSATDSTLVSTFETGVDDYQLKLYELNRADLVKIKMWSTQPINIFELGGLVDYPKESVVVDLGSSQAVKQIVTRYWAGTNRAAETRIFLSEDSVQWFELAQLDPENMDVYTIQVDFDTTARYVKLEHSMALIDYSRVYVWEVGVFDANGIYAGNPIPQVSNKTLGEILGMNTLWGWGHNIYTEYIPVGEGPALFDTISGFARNYHFMDWDVGDPDSIPVYDNMATEGTHYGFEWLDWDREYNAWINAGVQPHACIMFSHAFSPERWDSLNFSSAYYYGYEFAKYFGPTQGNGIIDKIEIGNEPWYYDSTQYRLIMSNMAQGIKAADPHIEVFPCALQAHDAVSETSIIGLKHYIGTRVTPADTAYLDGVNIHAYCWDIDAAGQRISTPPESRTSEFRSINNMIKWRDQNMPGKKLIVSEWGYDIDSANEPCIHSECVSERAGAVYTARGALLLQRMGVDEATVFWFANSVDTSTTFNRSGLLESTDNGFKKKNAYTALHTLVDSLEHAYFLDVIQEDDDAYIYIYGDSLGTPTHLVAWRPNDGDDTADVDATWWSPDYVPLHATRITGEQKGGTPFATPNYSNDTLYLSINSAPTIIRLAPNPCVDHLTISDIGSETFYTVDSTIISDAVLPANLGQEITYQAGESITLDGGFCVEDGTAFTAKIETCEIDSLLPLMQEKIVNDQ